MYNIFTGNILNTTKLPEDSNLVNVSLFHQLDSRMDFRSFSIKYVGSGKEYYTVNKKRYEVKKGQYLVANKYNEGRVMIDSTEAVRGICIDIAPSILSEAVMGYIQPGLAETAGELDSFFNSESFIENTYSCSETILGRHMLHIDAVISEAMHEAHSFSPEFYYTLATCIVKDHAPVLKQLHNIRSVKWSTRKDLFQRVMRGKHYLDDHCMTNVYIADAAQASSMSQYQFFRLFRSVFGMSPGQYLNNRKMRLAIQLLKKGDQSVSDISLLLGFYDLASFSRAFKKMYGVSPSYISRATPF